MKTFCIFFLFLSAVCTQAQQKQNMLPKEFVLIKEYIPNIKVDLSYCGSNNFIGRPVNGYKKNDAVFTKQATLALVKVEQELNRKNLGLKIYDAYRPQRAVNHFKEWAKAINDTITKNKYYPTVDKRNLFRDGYIASKSGHSRGSTIDLTIINLETQKELDMGTIFDYLGPESAHNFSKITPEQKKNRLLLKNLMIKYGFKPYSKEWWHYTFINEPYKETYFDFVIE